MFATTTVMNALEPGGVCWHAPERSGPASLVATQSLQVQLTGRSLSAIWSSAPNTPPTWSQASDPVSQLTPVRLRPARLAFLLDAVRPARLVPAVNGAKRSVTLHDLPGPRLTQSKP